MPKSRDFKGSAHVVGGRNRITVTLGSCADCGARIQSFAEETTMNRYVTLGATLLAGAVIGATAIKGLNAQAKPPTYVVIDITDMTDPEGFKAIPNSAAASPAGTAALGGRYVIRTETTTALEGTPPKRFVVLAFDNKEKAQGWYNAPDTKQINAIRDKTTKSRVFIVEGFAN
jgi:uncharacterized protein (DUF1330 family)